MNISIFGLSVTSSWGNGHATTYRSLIKGLKQLGHSVTFFERDVSWYASHRDMPAPEFCKTVLYDSLARLKSDYTQVVTDSDLLIVGSYVPDGVVIGSWVIQVAQGLTAFYDIDTPVTLVKLKNNDYEYLHPNLISQYDMYLSFSGGPVLDYIMKELGSPHAMPLYCSIDPELYYPSTEIIRWDLGYLGTYSADRQPLLNELLIKAAREWSEGRFVIAGPQYPETHDWPKNISFIEHLEPAKHNAFYNKQRYTLNITRKDMIEAGYSPSVRLFEAAACQVPIISDYWQGLETLFEPNREIMISASASQTLEIIMETPESQRIGIAERARKKVLESHTGRHRAMQLEAYVKEFAVIK